jgi:lipoic acid synthetase
MPRYVQLSQQATQSFEPKPAWLRVRAPAGENYERIKALLESHNLHTVCQEAHCPNVAECWGGGTATIMLMGDTCTRGCRFCMVKSGNPHGQLDIFEPEKVARVVANLSLTYVVLTSVDRDDLPDGGAEHFAKTIRAIKRLDPRILIEVLIPDFQGDVQDLKLVAEARPEVIAHNIETTMSLTPKVRDSRATYFQSLQVLNNIKKLDPTILSKSSIMLGLGESDDELLKTMQDLRGVDCDILTLGQYLRPSRGHFPVVEYVKPERFDYLRKEAESMGFAYVAAGPLVRSSYKAGEYFIQKILNERYRSTPHVETSSETLFRV